MHSVKVNGRRLDELSPEERAAHEERSRLRLEEMLASGKAPRVKSDDTFFRGWQDSGGGQFANPVVREAYRAEAAAAGVDITGKKYLPGLAEYPGDPMAWVGTRGDITRVCEERGYTCTGNVEVKPPHDPGPPVADVKIDPDIVDRIVGHRMEENPEADVEAVREAVIEKHGNPNVK